MAVAPLAERLGFGPTDRVVIVSADGLGVSHATTVGCYDALRAGGATSASLVMPGPWSRFAASQYRGEDVGVDLTLNAEHELLRWGPITQAPSLLDGDGGFPRTLLDVWDHADVDEVRRECRAQIERAVLWGFDVTHLTSHLATMQLRPELFDVYLDMALEFGLPMRLADASDQLAVGFPFRELAEEENVIAPDRVVGVLGGRIGESPGASLAEALACTPRRTMRSSARTTSRQTAACATPGSWPMPQRSLPPSLVPECNSSDGVRSGRSCVAERVGARRPEPALGVARCLLRGPEAVDVGDVRRYRKHLAVAVVEEFEVHERPVAGAPHVCEEPPVPIAFFDVAFEAHAGALGEHLVEVVAGLAAEALHGHPRIDRLGCIDPDQADPLGLSAEIDHDRVAVDDAHHGRVRREHGRRGA